MTATSELFLISPLIIVLATPALVMLWTVYRPNSGLSLYLGFLGVLLALVASPLFLEEAPFSFGRFFVTDNFTRVTQIGMLCAALIVIALSREWFSTKQDRVTEFIILLLISLAGALLLVMATHFLSFFLSLELLSVPLYAMIAYHVRQRRALEAGIKYILLAGFSVAILLFGLALLYQGFGTLEFDEIFHAARSLGSDDWGPIIWAGFTLFFAGIAFKAGLVPFHMWLPDVYEGAPLPVTAFMTTIAKGAVLFFTLHFTFAIGVYNLKSLAAMLATFSVMSMFLGNIMALKQQNLKRLLAYSSIAQVGYIFIGILSGSNDMITASLFYVFGYFAAVLCALGVLAIHANYDEEREQIKTFEGLFFLRPTLAIALSISLLSFTGLPLTVGFLSKFYMLLLGMEQPLLVLSLIVSSAIGFYAYFKIVLQMATRGSTTLIPQKFEMSLSEMVVVVLAILVVGLGIAPSLLTDFISQTI